MQKVLTTILPCGILPAVGQQISRASELGIFENQDCLRCWRDDFPTSLLFGDFPPILPMCTGQILLRTDNFSFSFSISLWTIGPFSRLSHCTHSLAVRSFYSIYHCLYLWLYA